MKVKEQLQYTADLYGVNCHDRIEELAERLNLDLSRKIGDLSLGNKKKVGIVSALLPSPKLLILDEPTSGLDPVSREELVELFRAIVADGQRSILFSTHITSDLEKCASHITFIKGGEIFHSAAVAEFMEAYADRGATLEDIIISVERRGLDESAII